MNNDDAKKILALYRPGTADGNDPVFQAAAELAKSDPSQGASPENPNPEVAKWFSEHCESYSSIRAKFLEIPVPPWLKEQILAGVPVAPEAPKAKVIWLRPAVWLQAAAAIVICLGLAVFFMRSHGSSAKEFDSFRNMMAGTAASPYAMPLHTHELAAMQDFFAKHHSPSEYVVPDSVAKAQPVGGAIARWQGAPVSMLCFHTGQTDVAAEKPDLWLLVADPGTLRNPPPLSATPIIARAATLMTATWMLNGRVYILATSGDEALLKQYL
jgi:hypothetical protein